MRKVSIASQIVILFVLVLLFSATGFTALTLSRIYFLAESETYSRLITYSSLLNNGNHLDKDVVDFPDMEIEFIIYDQNSKLSSPDIDKYINDEDLSTILDVNKNELKHYEFKKIKNHKGNRIYYVINVEPNHVSILLTDSTYVRNMVRTVALQIILMFLVVMLLSVLGIGAWSNLLVRRLHRIQQHILDLPKNSYETTYTDNGMDEIGELSRTVEQMRIEIKESEKTKQEMLQNVSHDFKTPIAVIQSYAEAQIDGMAGEDSSKIIISQAKILKHKVNRLLQYNSLQYLEKDREFEDVDMKSVVEEVIRTYKFQTDLEIVLDLAENIIFKGYKENYYTVVDNILDNAKHYAKTKIKIVLKKDRLRFYNDGDPIDEMFIKNSFKPYEKGSKGEFGLGMSIVKKTVEFFGMELIVKNEAIGVSFIITKSQK